MAYRVRNWRQFQHYKDRNPPWIKLYFSLISSKDWVMLDDASRVLAVASMLLASREDGRIPEDLQYLSRVAYLNSFPDLKPLIECGFLEEFNIESADNDSTMLADASKTLASASPETEKRQRREEAERTHTRVRDPVDNSKANGGWWRTESGIEAKGQELGLSANPGESWQQYKDRIFAELAKP